MKHALISKGEPAHGGFRVAQVVENEAIFEVASDLFWVDCTDDVVADLFWYDPVDSTIKSVPVPEPITPEPITSGETSTSGVQTL